MPERNSELSDQDIHFSAQNRPKRSGGPIPDYMLWQPRVEQSNPSKEIGLRTPDGDYYSFDHNESLSLITTPEGQRQPFIKMQNGQEVSFEAWKSARRQELANVFENVDQDYMVAYISALEDFPQLEQVGVEAATATEYPVLKYTGGFWKLKDGSPKIVVNMEQNIHYDQLLSDRELSARKSAEVIGIDFEIMKQNPNILKLFIFLHELGHTEDYITNYLKVSESDGSDPIETIITKRQNEINSLPIPGVDPASARTMFEKGELQQYYQKYQQYYQNIGLNSPEDLLSANEIAYHELPSEKYADQIAATILRKHWDSLVNAKQ